MKMNKMNKMNYQAFKSYEEFKNTIKFLDIKYIQVIMNKEEYLKFKELDLFSDQQDIFNKIYNWLDGQEKIYTKEEIIDKYAFWLDINNDYKIVEHATMFSDYDIYTDNLLYMYKDDNNEFQIKNQIILNYDKFIDLIS